MSEANGFMPRKPAQARSARVPWPGWATSRPCGELTLCGEPPGRRQAHHEGSTSAHLVRALIRGRDRGHASEARSGRAAAPQRLRQRPGTKPSSRPASTSWGESAHADLHQLPATAPFGTAAGRPIRAYLLLGMRGEGLGMAEPQLTRTDRSDGSYATCHAAIGGYIGGTPPIPRIAEAFRFRGRETRIKPMQRHNISFFAPPIWYILYFTNLPFWSYETHHHPHHQRMPYRSL